MAKPQTKDKINYTLHGCRVELLGIDEPLLESDFVRDLYENAFDGGGWDTTYRSQKWRGTMWHRVSDEMPGWIGKTYREYLTFCEKDQIEDIENIREHEIARVIG